MNVSCGASTRINGVVCLVLNVALAVHYERKASCEAEANGGITCAGLSLVVQLRWPIDSHVEDFIERLNDGIEPIRISTSTTSVARAGAVMGESADSTLEPAISHIVVLDRDGHLLSSAAYDRL